MKKTLIGLVLTFIIALSPVTVVLAGGSGGGGAGEDPIINPFDPVIVSLPIELPPNWQIDCPPPHCPEDCQGEDNDEQ